MKKILAVLSAVVLATLSACGGTPCSALKCDKCTPTSKTACEILVKSNNQTACESALGKPEYSTCQ
ncbi:MAG: hypothetical protein Q8L48_14570 [Archangium sp.]|nr:hypothetical protein [Archangium sp.]